ncbi:MAG: S41 family peptidase [Desulfovibrio sp.]|jgi:carboxyl-terminal processing protease|nr:S41 family peptidase [Desulfovibrio sp.]
MRVFGLCCLLGLLICCGIDVADAAAPAPAPTPAPAPAPAPADGAQKAAVKVNPSKFEALKRFSQVLDLVERFYVRDVGQGDLINGAVKGMLQGLDPHSTLMNAEEYKEMQQSTSGEFFGVGIEISLENNQVVVVAPIEDTPAYRAGLLTGDIIVSINGQPTQELSLQEVVSRIRGPKGTEVELVIIHKEAKSAQTVRIVRDAIPLISVKSKQLEEGYYWMRLTRFSERTTEELRHAIVAAEKDCKASGGMKGIVLDLRSNPGGLLDQATSVADIFLHEGVIVSIKGRLDVTDHVYTANAQDDDVKVPVVVLINAGSASASEIVAGALRDQKRALLVGERSFGKGSVQKIIPLADGSGLKLTVALYYTPNGSSIQAEGIQPDLEAAFEPPKPEDKDRFLVREQNLNRHLETKKDKKKTDKDKKDEGKEQLARDSQLRLALQMVKNLPKISELHSN